ncbi:hypothetical protein SNARM312S_04830 [Streptomyces narbonensis]
MAPGAAAVFSGRARAARARSSPGVRPKTSRTVSLKVRMEEKPAAKAISPIGSGVVSMRTRAVWARWARARARGPAPSSARSWRSIWRVDQPSRRASPGTPSRSTTPSWMRRMARATASARTCHSGEPGLVSGRHRLQARNPARWQDAALGWNSMFSGLGGTTGQLGRQ